MAVECGGVLCLIFKNVQETEKARKREREREKGRKEDEDEHLTAGILQNGIEILVA